MMLVIAIWAHAVGGGGAVPVLHTGRGPDDIAGLDLLLRAALFLHPAAACRHDQGLAGRVGVPRRARARLEADEAARRGGGVVYGIERGHDDRAGEEVG